VGLGQLDCLLSREEQHLPRRDRRRLDPVTGIGVDALLLDRHLQHSPQDPVVAMHRAGGDAAELRCGWARPRFEDAMRELSARLEAELGEHLAEVVLDGVRADEQLRSDLLIVGPEGDKF
jgi:hypothetical protein